MLRNLVGTFQAPPFSDSFSDNVMHEIRNVSYSTKKNSRPFPFSIEHLFPRVSVFHLAAAFVLLAAVGTFSYLREYAIVVPYGEVATHTLSDGTSVQLSSGSVLSYQPFWGRAERAVRLQGEAFFDVESSEKPFVVKTFNAEVRVLGTSFNVKSWPQANAKETYIALAEGKIAVSPTHAADQITYLAPSESITISSISTSPAATTLTEQEIKEVQYWRTGGYSFKNETLSEVFQELERRHNVRLLLPPELSKLPTAYVQPNTFTIEQVLEDLSILHGFAVQKTANGFEAIIRAPVTSPDAQV